MSKLELSILCYKCGVIFTALVDTPNLMQKCPRCYNKQMTKCFYCDATAEFTQPEKDTGKIIDVCKKHFTWMHAGQEKP